MSGGPASDRVRAAFEALGLHPTSTSGDSYMIKCPAHDDGTASLKVTVGTDRVLMHCHGNCAKDDVLAALKLARSDLFDSPKTKAEPVGPADTYRYVDEAGKLLFEVQRKYRNGKKTFVQRRPNGRGGWAYQLDGVRRVIYRLPAVIEALGRGETVYIAEGEKDVHALEAAGVVATCNPAGAGKWTDAYSAIFADRDVVIIADKDGPGRKHADEVRRSIETVGATVTVKEAAAVGKDAYDHLSAGHTVGEFVIVSAPEVEEVSAVRRLVPVLASSIKPKRVRWVWADRIVLGGLTLLAGREGLGKSTVAGDLVAQLTRGQLEGEFLGQQRHVVYITSEDAREYTVVPRLIAAGADLDKVLFIDVHHGTSTSSPVVLPLDLDALAELIEEYKVGLVVLDAATSVMDGRLDGDRDRQMRQALEPVARMAENTDCAVLGICHFGKRESSDTGKLILGSIAWSQVARSVIAVAKDEETGNLVISNTKANLSPGDTPSLSAAIKEATVEIEGDEPANVGKVFWLGECERDARELLDGGASEDEEDRTERDMAAEWLREYLSVESNAKSADVKKAAHGAGFSDRTLQRARQKLRVEFKQEGFPRITYWSLPDSRASGATSEVRAREGGTTGPGGTTGADQAKQNEERSSNPSRASRASRATHVHDCEMTGTTESAQPAETPELALPFAGERTCHDCGHSDETQLLTDMDLCRGCWGES